MIVGAVTPCETLRSSVGSDAVSEFRLGSFSPSFEARTTVGGSTGGSVAAACVDEDGAGNLMLLAVSSTECGASFFFPSFVSIADSTLAAFLCMPLALGPWGVGGAMLAEGFKGNTCNAAGSAPSAGVAWACEATWLAEFSPPGSCQVHQTTPEAGSKREE